MNCKRGCCRAACGLAVAAEARSRSSSACLTLPSALRKGVQARGQLQGRAAATAAAHADRAMQQEEAVEQQNQQQPALMLLRTACRRKGSRMAAERLRQQHMHTVP